MQVRCSRVLAAVAALATVGSAECQEETAEPAPVPLTQRRTDPLGNTVETEGFFVGFGQRLALSEEGLAGEFVYAGRTYRFQVNAEAPAAPTIRVDLDGDGDPANDAPLPDAAYPSRSEGYMQACFEPVAGHPLRLICVFKGRNFYSFLDVRSSWCGEAYIDGRTFGVVAFDRNANGDLSDDTVLLDLDGDGKIVPVEVVKPGEAVRIGERGMDLRVDPTGGSLSLGLRPAAEGDRDILGELERAPLAGRPCPAFSFTDPAGTAFSDESLRGKVVLLNFWADW